MKIYEFNKYNNFNIMLERVKEYNPNGRNQTEEEATKLDKKILDLLTETKTSYIKALGCLEGYDAIVKLIYRLIRGEVLC